MIIKPFDAWREERVAETRRKTIEVLDSGQAPEPRELKCPECNGEGGMDCDCGCPNCQAVVDCDMCSGVGHIETHNPLVMEEVEIEKFDRSEYLRHLARDLVALSEWQGKPSLFHIVDAGLAPATIILHSGTKTLVLHDPDMPNKQVDVSEQVPRT